MRRKSPSLESEKVRVLGEAESKVKTMTETAKSNLYKLKMSVFENDGNAFLRYSMSEKLSPKLGIATVPQRAGHVLDKYG